MRLKFIIYNLKFIVRKGQRGTSLIELLLYMAILSALLIVLTRIFISALDVQLESEAGSAIEQDGNYILAKLAYDMHRAKSIAIPSANGDSGSSFRVVVNGANYTYSLDGNSNLILTNDLGVNSLNSYDSNVSSFMAQRLGNGKVEDTLKISYTITSRTKRASGTEAPRNFQTTLSLRRQ